MGKHKHTARPHTTPAQPTHNTTPQTTTDSHTQAHSHQPPPISVLGELWRVYAFTCVSSAVPRRECGRRLGLGWTAHEGGQWGSLHTHTPTHPYREGGTSQRRSEVLVGLSWDAMRLVVVWKCVMWGQLLGGPPRCSSWAHTSSPSHAKPHAYHHTTQDTARAPQSPPL